MSKFNPGDIVRFKNSANRATVHDTTVNDDGENQVWFEGYGWGLESELCLVEPAPEAIDWKARAEAAESELSKTRVTLAATELALELAIKRAESAEARVAELATVCRFAYDLLVSVTETDAPLGFDQWVTQVLAKEPTR